MKKIVLILAVVIICSVAYWMIRPSPYDSGTPLLSNGGSVQLLDGLDTNVLPNGWLHQTFFRITPADYSMTEEGGTRILRCTTNNSASILVRDTQISVAKLPMLSWRWKVTHPIESDIDEATEDGDDHPVRLYLQFSNEDGDMRGAEIIWSNKKYVPGDYKIIDSFYHYVANGLNRNTQQWHDQIVDLRQLYSDIGGTGTATLEALGFFCDSDNTGTRSDGSFSDVVLSAKSN